MLDAIIIVYLCTDINTLACQCTIRTGAQNKVSKQKQGLPVFTPNKVPLDAINSSFALPLRARLRHSVDVILFNPPYVPTIDAEAQEAQETLRIQGSWAGGSDGMLVTNLFLETVHASSCIMSLWPQKHDRTFRSSCLQVAGSTLWPSSRTTYLIYSSRC